MRKLGIAIAGLMMALTASAAEPNYPAKPIA